jgi:hypothetical protein
MPQIFKIPALGQVLKKYISSRILLYFDRKARLMHRRNKYRHAGFSEAVALTSASTSDGVGDDPASGGSARSKTSGP